MSNDAPHSDPGNQPLSNATRNYVWQGLLDGVRYVRYYGALHQRYNRRHQISASCWALRGFVRLSR